MRRTVTCAWLALVGLSCRDLTLPPDQPGRVTGVVVTADSLGIARPAPGVLVSIRRSSISTLTNAAGFFELAPIPFAHGQLDLELDDDGDGVADRRRAIAFDDRGIRPGHESDLGEISLRDSASVLGRILLAGQPGLGHAGTIVYAPGLPFSTTTGAEGSFALSGLPEGPVTLSAFHQGFTSRQLEGLELRSGEVLTLAPRVLDVAAGGGAEGTLTGAIELSPPGDFSTVQVLTPGRSDVVVTVRADGRFEGRGAPGLVTLVVRAPGYSDLVQPNIGLPEGGAVDLGTLVLAAGAGRFALVDAGSATDGGGLVIGCGDGVVSAFEVCDDGNRQAGDGCAPSCVLELQGPGGAWCVDAVPLTLVPVGGGRLAAHAGGDGDLARNFTGDCAPPAWNDTVYRLTLTAPSIISVAVTSNQSEIVSVREEGCSGEELACRPFSVASPVLAPGSWLVVVYSSSAGGAAVPYTLDVAVEPIAPGLFCGDGLVTAPEQCDDGNPRSTDGCLGSCRFQAQRSGASCTAATPLALVQTSSTSREALAIGASPAGYDATIAPSCADGGVFTHAFSLTLANAATVTVDATPSSTGIDQDLAVAIRPGGVGCGLPELGCVNASGSSAAFDTESLSRAVDAGTWVVVVRTMNLGGFEARVRVAP